MMNQETEIEKACASVATAMALLIAAVRLPPLAEGDDRNSVLPELPDNPGIDTTSFCTPADRRIFVYCAGSAGLAALARDHGPKIMSKLGLKTSYITKCGTTALELSTRLRQIGQDQYGAAVRTENGIETQDGFKAWVAHAITTSRQSRDRAVKVTTRAIVVDRPVGLTSRIFDNELHRALKSRALDALPAAIWPRRFGCYDLVETRHSAAREFYALCPYNEADGDLLLEAIEGVLKRFRERRTKMS